MTETIAELSAQLETLNAARASGVRTVSYQANGVNRSVEYRSDREMAMAQMDIERRIAALQTDVPRCSSQATRASRRAWPSATASREPRQTLTAMIDTQQKEERK